MSDLKAASLLYYLFLYKSIKTCVDTYFVAYIYIYIYRPVLKDKPTKPKIKAIISACTTVRLSISFTTNTIA